MPPAAARLSGLVPARAGRGEAGHAAGGQPAGPQVAFLARFAVAGPRRAAGPRRGGLAPAGPVGGPGSCRSRLRLNPVHACAGAPRLQPDSLLGWRALSTSVES